jgi:hypothetical protein
MESKKKIYDLMPEALYPPTIFFKKDTPISSIEEKIRNNGWAFPLIAKPDIGGKGKAVKKLHNIAELLQYAQISKADFLVQQYIKFEEEVGIFYYRYPDQEKGSISGIVYKELLAVTGDGSSTLEELLLLDKRFILQLPSIRKTYGKEMKKILPAGEKKIVVPYGNHARGAKFVDVSHLIDEELINTFDNICKQVKEFYYGRLDVRYNTWEELKQGKNISVIELNGAGSEPTHIYDPKHSIFFAWKEIIRHWHILWKISAMNHKMKAIPYMSFAEGMKMFRDNSAYEKMMKEAA